MTDSPVSDPWRLPPHWPAPPEEARRLGAVLLARIHEAIAEAGGAIDFARFMELCLYAPGLGYYSAGLRKFGAGGDFVTAPETSPLFSRCVARACAPVLADLDGDLLELGAGSGTLAAEALAELERLERLPGTYWILERSAELRQRQAETLQARVPVLAGRVRWLEHLPEPGFRGVVLANEVLDALPVHRFRWRAGGAEELVVAGDGGGLRWQARPAPPPLARAVAALTGEVSFTEGYTGEVNLGLGPWLQSLAERLDRGLMLLVDYGYPRRELYHPERAGGTLMCHYRHRAHGEALLLPGLQDITAHVDFTAVAEAGVGAGLELLGFATQAHFLMDTGIDELMGELDTGGGAAYLAQVQAVKTLMLPGEMGERFKCMALGRGVDPPVTGFRGQDLRNRL